MQPFLGHWANQILYAIPNILTALAIFVVSLYLAGPLPGSLEGFWIDGASPRIWQI